MSRIPPMVFGWDGEAMTPAFPKLADRHYVVGERYTLEPASERSQQSHNHFFAVVNEAWGQLCEDQVERFPSAEHLRKWALIQAGYRDERTIVVSSKTEALRLAAFIKPMDEYAVVTVRNAVVRVYTAKSQAMRAMGKAEFQQCKDDVRAVLDDLIGVAPGTLDREAGRAA